jgi:hypothetical protein
VRPRAGPRPSLLSQSLERCATICKETIAAYLQPAQASENTFGQALLAAIAAVETAAAHDTSSPPDHCSASLEIASELCRAAAQECRRHGFDEPLLRAADACERAATICEDALR